MLWQEMMKECVLLEEYFVADGEGGRISNWVAVREFKAAIVREVSNETPKQERAAQNASYRVTTDIPMYFRDVFRCNGKAYMVTEDAINTPYRSSFNFWQCKAERLEVLDAD